MAKAKEIVGEIKLVIPGGGATPAPPVGPALGAKGVNIGAFVKQFNDATASMKGETIPVVITVFKDKTFTFVLKQPPVSAPITKAQVKEIAQKKLAEMTAASLEAAMKTVAGTARSMGVVVAD